MPYPLPQSMPLGSSPPNPASSCLPWCASFHRAPFQSTRLLTLANRNTAQSPTMTEGSISEWKVNEGESFAAGDVLLSVETDKAAIDVEAQDDGIMGKILVSLSPPPLPLAGNSWNRAGIGDP